MEEIKQSGEIILFIDEVHTLIGAGADEGAIDAANILKPALARGELQVSCFFKDPAKTSQCYKVGGTMCILTGISETVKSTLKLNDVNEEPNAEAVLDDPLRGNWYRHTNAHHRQVKKGVKRLPVITVKQSALFDKRNWSLMTRCRS
ncbi:hypothetical protein MKW98_026722 [Papaver atlanticum]|uniref:Uncharacterized protein n=1 Tax=Papaver atlanticum TaxID=357466 RepID=A0AAD4S1B6_9MAGN|nr:hypothetical protein MKW98_026722 [Papaver atlanticum]